MRQILTQQKCMNHIANKVCKREGKKHEMTVHDFREALAIMADLFHTDKKFRVCFVKYFFFKGAK